MVWVVVELHFLVCVTLLEVILCSSRQSSCLRSLQTVVIAAEALAIDIIVVVLAIVRHCKGCIIILDNLQLPSIFSFIINIQAVSFITYIRMGTISKLYLSYFTDGFNRSCNECIKASLAVKVSSFAFTTS